MRNDGMMEWCYFSILSLHRQAWVKWWSHLATRENIPGASSGPKKKKTEGDPYRHIGRVKKRPKVPHPRGPRWWCSFAIPQTITSLLLCRARPMGLAMMCWIFRFFCIFFSTNYSKLFENYSKKFPLFEIDIRNLLFDIRYSLFEDFFRVGSLELAQT